MIPTLRIHTHCQVAQTHSKTKAWERVCLFQHKTKTTEKPREEEDHRTDISACVAIAGEVLKIKCGFSI